MSTSHVAPALTPSAFIGARFGPGKVVFPLSNGVQYANFDHVRGIPADEESGGYSVNRLHILNAILERYARIEGEQAYHFDGSEDEVTMEAVEDSLAALQEAVQGSVYGRSYGNGIYETGVGFSAEG